MDTLVLPPVVCVIKLKPQTRTDSIIIRLNLLHAHVHTHAHMRTTDVMTNVKKRINRKKSLKLNVFFVF